MTNKYLEKIADIRDLAKAYAGHVSGKTLQKAEISKSVLDGFKNAHSTETKAHKEMFKQYQAAGSHDHMASEMNRHRQNVNGQNSAQGSVFHTMGNRGQLHSGDLSSETLNKLRMKKNLAQAGTALVAAGVVHGAYKAGQKSNKN